MTINKGCSACESGQEKYEKYFSDTLRKKLIQYDYRTNDGKLFSCVASSLEKARDKKNKWLQGVIK